MDPMPHRIDCVDVSTDGSLCAGCQLAACYEAIRMLMAQYNNPKRDKQNEEKWEAARSMGGSVLPECKPTQVEVE